jgi:hypothetical protein
MLDAETQDKLLDQAAEELLALIEERAPLPERFVKKFAAKSEHRDAAGPVEFGPVRRVGGPTEPSPDEVEEAFANYMIGQGLARPGEAIPAPGPAQPDPLSIVHGRDGEEPIGRSVDGLEKMFAGRDGAAALDAMGRAWLAWSVPEAVG